MKTTHQSDRPKLNSKSKFGFLALDSGVFEDEFPSDISLLRPFGSIPFNTTKNQHQKNYKKSAISSTSLLIG